MGTVVRIYTEKHHGTCMDHLGGHGNFYGRRWGVRHAGVGCMDRSMRKNRHFNAPRKVLLASAEGAKPEPGAA